MSQQLVRKYCISNGKKFTNLCVLKATANSGLDFYKSGIFTSTKCNPKKVDHGVVIVGYGTDAKSGDFWIVRNSWGKLFLNNLIVYDFLILIIFR